MNRRSTGKSRSAKSIADRITPNMDRETYQHLAMDYEHKASMIDYKANERYMNEVKTGGYNELKPMDNYLTDNEKTKRDNLLKKADVYNILAEKAPYQTEAERLTAEAEAEHEAWIARIEKGSLDKTVSEENKKNSTERIIRWRTRTANLPWPSLPEVGSVVLLVIGMLLLLFPGITGMVIGGYNRTPINISGLLLFSLGILGFAFFKARISFKKKPDR